MTAKRFQRLDEMAAELFREGSPISTYVESAPATSIDHPIVREAAVEPGAPDAAGEGRNETTMPDQPESPLAGSTLETAIRLRWVLRDIKAQRMKMSPLSPDDLGTLIEMGLVQMKDDVPELTDQGHRALK